MLNIRRYKILAVLLCLSCALTFTLVPVTETKAVVPLLVAALAEYSPEIVACIVAAIAAGINFGSPEAALDWAKGFMDTGQTLPQVVGNLITINDAAVQAMRNYAETKLPLPATNSAQIVSPAAVIPAYSGEGTQQTVIFSGADVKNVAKPFYLTLAQSVPLEQFCAPDAGFDAFNVSWSDPVAEDYGSVLFYGFGAAELTTRYVESEYWELAGDLSYYDGLRIVFDEWAGEVELQVQVHESDLAADAWDTLYYIDHLDGSDFNFIINNATPLAVPVSISGTLEYPGEDVDMAPAIPYVPGVPISIPIPTTWDQVIDVPWEKVIEGSGTGDDTRINFEPLRLSFDGFTTAFPFSLPWDLLHAFQGLPAGTTKAPVFDMNINMPFFKWQQTLDFSLFDPIMPTVRILIQIGFGISLILITRELLGGAS